MKELIEIQAELKAPKNQKNSFGNYNYRSCEDILEAVKPLAKTKECLITLTEEAIERAGMIWIQATANIMNKEGVKISVNACAGVDFQAKGMQTPQRFGAASSYARKYALGGLFLIDDTKDADTEEHHKETHARAEKEEPKLPWLNKDTDNFNNAKAAISAGTHTLADVRKKYAVSKEVAELLTK